MLALAVTEHAALPADIQRFVVVLATGLVLFTLFINGTSLRVAIRLLGIDRLSLRDAALRDQIQAFVLRRGTRCRPRNRPGGSRAVSSTGGTRNRTVPSQARRGAS